MMNPEDMEFDGQCMELPEAPYCQNDDPAFVEEREARRQAGIRAKSVRAIRAGCRDVRPKYYRRLERGRNGCRSDRMG